MGDNKLDITSTALEKGLDIAKDFLDKLIMPAVEEVGLLIANPIKLWQLRSQIKVLNRSKEICEKNNISPKALTLKVLCPLLDFAGLEEDEFMQDKWAVLLSNMVDSEQNIQNHVFPYILSQLSITEYAFLEAAAIAKIDRDIQSAKELEDMRRISSVKLVPLYEELDRITIKEKEEESESTTEILWPYQSKFYGERRNIQNQIEHLNKPELDLISTMGDLQTVLYGEVEDHEMSNLIRLGVVRSEVVSYAYAQPHRIENDPREEYLRLNDLEIEIHKEYDDYRLTKLGELFIDACREKGSKSN